jgi:ribonuclease HII
LINTNEKLLFEIENKKVCGIDEAGRGAIAGPLVFAGVILKKEIPFLKDSKKLSPKKREALFESIIKNSKYHIVIIDSEEIDEIGLSKSIQKALKSIKEAFKDEDINFLFDGNSPFGVKEIFTLVKADDKIPEVSAASILAKVTRDKIMVELSKKYLGYGFEKHKGYCTKAHLDSIQELGISKVHRKSFKIPLKSVTKNIFGE